MKKGLNQWSAPVGTPVRELIRNAASAGFSGVELLYREQAELGPHLPIAEAREIGRYAAGLGVEILGFACGTLLEKYSLVHGSPDDRNTARSVVEHMFGTADALGGGSILCVPGVVDSEHPYDEVFEKVRAYLPAVAPYAEEHQVDLCIENTWNSFLLSPLEMRALIDETDSPRVGCYFDVGNILPFGFPDQWIRILGSRIKRIHVKDYRKSVAGLAGLVGLGEGDVDWRAVMEALRAVGYDGYLTAELPPPKLHYDRTLHAVSSFLDGIIGREDDR